jgi:hypothetical protein
MLLLKILVSFYAVEVCGCLFHFLISELYDYFMLEDLCNRAVNFFFANRSIVTMKKGPFRTVKGIDEALEM